MKPPANDDASLRGRQLRFAGAVMSPDSGCSAMADHDARGWLTAGPQMTAIERLEIYQRGYQARLVECLADDYPSVKHALGDAAFESLCRAYIARHPSGGPNLNYFGRRMANFIREEALPPLPLRAFAADLASLEWAMVEVIHAPSAPPLTLESFGGVPMDAWPRVRLEASTALRLLRFEYPVNAYFRALREGDDPPAPGAAASATVVYRSGPTIWRMDLTPPMLKVLSALVAGEPLGDALARAEKGLAHLPESEAGERVRGWFAEWVRSGLFVRVEW